MLRAAPSCLREPGGLAFPHVTRKWVGASRWDSTSSALSGGGPARGLRSPLPRLRAHRALGGCSWRSVAECHAKAGGQGAVPLEPGPCFRASFWGLGVAGKGDPQGGALGGYEMFTLSLGRNRRSKSWRLGSGCHKQACWLVVTRGLGPIRRRHWALREPGPSSTAGAENALLQDGGAQRGAL